MTRTVLTVGHGTASQDELTALLVGADVGSIVDVRRFPGSRRHPHAAREAMEVWLPAAGVDYRWEQRLGGRRRLPRGDDSDAWWQVEAFRAYASYTRTAEFAAAVRDLLAEVDARPEGSVAVMCSESLWWRCHRRLVSDVLVLLHDVRIVHLAHDGRLSDHRPSAGARVTAAGLRYDADDGSGAG